MAELPQMPWYPRDYQADTRHLTLEEHGAYRMLLDLLWIGNCTGLPSDDVRLSRMLGITPKEWVKLKPVILSFFYKKDDDFYSHHRVERDWEKVSSRVEQNRKNREGKSLKNNEHGLTVVTTNDTTKHKEPLQRNDNETATKPLIYQNQKQIEEDKPPPYPTSLPNSVEPLGGGVLSKAILSDVDELCEIPDPEPLRRRPRLENQADHSAPLPDSPGKPVCEAYMAAVTAVYGTAHTLLHAGSGASVIAERWLHAGADLNLIRSEFETTLQTRKAKGEQPPNSLSYFDQIIARAIKQASAPMPEAQGKYGSAQVPVGLHADAVSTQWRGRVKGFVDKGLWMDSWGPTPSEPFSDCPRGILVEFGFGKTDEAVTAE